MSVVLSRDQRERLKVAYLEHTTDPKYAPVIEEAKGRGYRLAKPWEREHLDDRDIYCWRRTLWVKLESS